MPRAAGYDGDTHTNGPRDDRTRCLCAASAVFTLTAPEPHLSEEGFCSRLPSSVPGVWGGERLPGWHRLDFSTCSPGVHSKLMLSSLSDWAFKFRVNPVSACPPQHPLPPGRLICRPHQDIYNFLSMFSSLVNSFNPRVLTL